MSHPEFLRIIHLEKLPFFITFLCNMLNQISIWLSQDECVGRKKKISKKGSTVGSTEDSTDKPKKKKLIKKKKSSVTDKNSGGTSATSKKKTTKKAKKVRLYVVSVVDSRRKIAICRGHRIITIFIYFPRQKARTRIAHRKKLLSKRRKRKRQ